MSTLLAGHKLTAADFGAWTDFQPVWTNLAPNNGNWVARFKQEGKRVTVWIRLIFGTTTAVTGNVSVLAPVAPRDGCLATVRYLDSGTRHYVGAGHGATGWNLIHTESGNSGLVGVGAPHGWAVGDVIELLSTYEAA